MEIANEPITEGVNLFVNIVIILVAFVAALSFLDFRRESKKESK